MSLTQPAPPTLQTRFCILSDTFSSVWYVLVFFLFVFFFFPILNLLSWTVMNVSLDTLNNSEWSEFFVGPCCTFLYRYAFAKLCLSLATHVKLLSSCLYNSRNVEPVWPVYSVNVFCFLLFFLFFLQIPSQIFSDFE